MNSIIRILAFSIGLPFSNGRSLNLNCCLKLLPLIISYLNSLTISPSRAGLSLREFAAESEESP